MTLESLILLFPNGEAHAFRNVEIRDSVPRLSGAAPEILPMEALAQAVRRLKPEDGSSVLVRDGESFVKVTFNILTRKKK